MELSALMGLESDISNPPGWARSSSATDSSRLLPPRDVLPDSLQTAQMLDADGPAGTAGASERIHG